MRGRPITIHCPSAHCRRLLDLWHLRQMQQRGKADALYEAALIAYGVTEAELPSGRPKPPERVPDMPTRLARRHGRLVTLTWVECPECGHKFETTALRNVDVGGHH